MIKKDEIHNKHYKNIQVLKATKGDIVGLEAIDTQPNLTYNKAKDNICRLEKLSLKKVSHEYSLIVSKINLGR